VLDFADGRGRRTFYGLLARVGSIVKIAAATVAVMGVVLVAAFGSAYGSRIVKVASHISIRSHHNTTFTGRVRAPSDPGGCEPERRVTLYTTTKLKLGTAKTNIHGYWKIKASGFAGISLHHFFAKVARFPNGAAGTIYLCEGATSKTIRF
jgi:hypothetical protein